MPIARSADGASIHFEVVGDGPAVVLQHGFSQSLEHWHVEGYVDALRTSYRLILIDARGHGASEKPYDPAAYVMERRVEDAEAVLDTVSESSAHYVGYSMGGHIGFGVAKYKPERLSSLVIGGMHPFPRDHEAMTARAEMLRERGAVESFVAQLESVSGERMPEPRRALYLANDAEALAASTLATRDDGRLGDDPDQRQIETLIYCGSLDPNHDLARRGAAEMPRAEFVSIDGLNHLQTFERSEVAIPYLLDFLERATSD